MKEDRRSGHQDRRTGKERRVWDQSLEYPFVDSHGDLVTQDRRINGERRNHTENSDRRNFISH